MSETAFTYCTNNLESPNRNYAVISLFDNVALCVELGCKNPDGCKLRNPTKVKR